MKTFRHIVTEATKAKSRVILFGRMNPITRGHEENVDAAHKIAQKHGADLHVIASHSHDAKKNPLSAEQKTRHMKRAFGHLSNTELKTSSKEAPTILHHAAQAHAAGVKHLIIAGGGDRASGYHKLLHDYNGVKGKAHGHYHFDKISIENTGERKEGVSGTDMRKHASGGHFDKFRAGLPSKIAKNEKHSQEMYQHVRHGMGVKEDTRESYVSGHSLRLGEAVLDQHTGMTGTVVYRGPTYVTVQIDEDTSFKRWIKDVDSLAEPTQDTGMLTLRDLLEPVAEAKSEQDLDDKDIKAIEDSVDKLEWDHVKHLFADDIDEELELDEALTAAQRIKKRFEFMKTKSKREIANKLARHRISTPQRMKKRAVVHARTLIMQRLLRGRSKGQLSAAEKDRVETIVRNAKQSVIRISNRLLPKLRQLEMKRLKQVHESQRPNQATDLVYDGEEHGYETTTTPGTDTTGNERLTAFKSHLGGAPTQDKGVLDDGKHMRKIKHYRKMEV
jgi:HEPN domain-containing protein